MSEAQTCQAQQKCPISHGLYFVHRAQVLGAHSCIAEETGNKKNQGIHREDVIYDGVQPPTRAAPSHYADDGKTQSQQH